MGYCCAERDPHQLRRVQHSAAPPGERGHQAAHAVPQSFPRAREHTDGAAEHVSAGGKRHRDAQHMADERGPATARPRRNGVSDKIARDNGHDRLSQRDDDERSKAHRRQDGVHDVHRGEGAPVGTDAGDDGEALPLPPQYPVRTLTKLQMSGMHYRGMEHTRRCYSYRRDCAKCDIAGLATMVSRLSDSCAVTVKYS